MRSLFFVVVLLMMSLSCGQQSDPIEQASDHILVVIKRNYDRPPHETANVIIDWKEVTSRLPRLESSPFRVKDQHFDTELEATLIDTNADRRPDVLSILYPFDSSEPQFTLMIKEDPDAKPVVMETNAEQTRSDDRFELTFLQTYRAFTGMDSITDWPVKIFESSLAFYPDPAEFTIISPGQWTYEHGLFLGAGFQLWKRTNNSDYFDYIKSWIDLFLNEDGRIKASAYDVNQYRLDDILPGRLCLFLYQETGDDRYRVASEQLVDHLKHQPKTTEGGYWHKEIYPNQMWLDGVYMADIFTMHYAKTFNRPELFDEAVRQILLISNHTRDPRTGLMYHGWDESKNHVWADPATGTSPSFWGRAIGWYLMAIVDCLDYLPQDHPDREQLVGIFKDLAQSVARYQDEKSGLWFQVVDKGSEPGNWLETSCSAMFAYGFAKGHNRGLLDSSYRERAEDAFKSIISNYTYYDHNGNLYLDQTVKVGTLNMKVSKGDYAYYIRSERRINDYKGLGALLYAALALSEAQKSL